MFVGEYMSACDHLWERGVKDMSELCTVTHACTKNDKLECDNYCSHPCTHHTL